MRGLDLKMVDKKIFQLCNSVAESEALKEYGSKENYNANIKFDGERILGIVEKGIVILFNRAGHICKFSEVETDLAKLPNCILDGEVISADGIFNNLQRRALTRDKAKVKQLEKDIPCLFMVFDILTLDGKDVRNLPLSERVEILKGINFTGSIRICEYLSVESLLKSAKENDEEGIIIKDMNKPYLSARTNNWVKCKYFKEDKLKVVRYTINPSGIRVENDTGEIAIQVAGKQSDLVKAKIDSDSYCEIFIQYLEKTADGKLRFPSFRGIVD